MARPIRARIDLAAVEANLRLAAELAPGARVMAMVKADAYGHGAVPVARALAPHADAFGVAGLEEALELRLAGIDRPILTMAGAFQPAELHELAAARVDTVVHCPEQLEALLAARLERPLRVWLKADTGMHRLGLDPGELAAAHARLAGAEQVSEVVLMTHLARADELANGSTDRQADSFQRAVDGIEGATSLANSAAILAWPACHADWVRPGIMLYGVNPLDGPTEAAARLAPAMELTTEIISVRRLAAGEAVGYGGRFVARRPTRIGVAAAGYGDGYPRHAPDGTPVLVNGRRARLAGRVSMDLLAIDLEEVGEVAVGDPVELWGKALPAAEVAAACGTIGYELLTRVGRRVPRVYRPV